VEGRRGAPPGTAEALAEALRVTDRSSEAIAVLREALRLDPDSAMAHTDLGFVLDSEQSTEEALKEYREALRLDSDFVDAHNYLGIALARQQRIPAAVEEYLRLAPDTPQNQRNIRRAQDFVQTYENP